MGEIMEMEKIMGELNRELLIEDMSVSGLVNDAVRKGEGRLTEHGALLIHTGKYTGRSPKDRYIVRDEVTKDTVAFGKTNLPMEEETYRSIKAKVLDYIRDRKMYLIRAKAGAAKKSSMTINVLCEDAVQALFSKQIFIRDDRREGYDAEFTVIAVPGLKCDAKKDGINSEACIVISFKDRLVLISGTRYSGEIKKSVFSVMNYLLPEKGILPMHCSANTDEKGNTALFFGLSGTGKTTLSADPNRILIGDDEHGWSDDEVFNIEGGCYAKTINLDREKEKEIYEAIRFGSVLENVVVDKDGVPDYTDKSLTENTRCTYPLDFIPNASSTGEGAIPKTIIFLTADAFGVIPPVSRLSKDAAMYHFMSGYTSKLAGTERGIVTPEITFSALFGEPFMPRRIEEYAELLGKKIEALDTDVYLINTGWTGGVYGVGKRMSLSYTRKMVDAALNGSLRQAKFVRDGIFNIDIPDHVDGVPSEILFPESQWADKAEYRKTAEALAERFRKNFERFPEASESIKKAGPTAVIRELQQA